MPDPSGETPDQVEDVVVVGQRPNGNYYVWYPMVNVSYEISQDRYDEIVAGGGTNGVVLNADDAIETAIYVFTEFLKIIREFPTLSASEKAQINTLINAIDNAQNAYELGQISREEFRSAVTGGLEFFYGQVGDYLISAVTGAIIGTAGAAGSSPTGPGSMAIGITGVAIGAAMSQIWPADQLAELTAGAIFGAADAIDAIERGLGSSIQDRLFQWNQEFENYIYRNLPEDTRGLLTLGSVGGPVAAESVNGVSVYSGSIGSDRVSFAAAGAAIAIDMSIVGDQQTGGAGVVKLLTIEGVEGSGADDVILGNSAGNLIAGGAGNDYLDGRGGFDTLDYRSATAGVVVSLVLATQNTQGAGVDTIIGFEAVFGSGFSDSLTGDGLANVLYGSGGSDTINAGAGDDVLYGNGNGATVIAETNILDGGEGSDTVSYEFETGDLTIYLDLESGSGGYASSSSGLVSDGLSNIENAVGGSGRDHIVGSSAANRLSGGAGNDWLLGVDGDDTIEGGQGDDDLNGGAGFDYLSYMSASSGVTVNFEIADMTYWYQRMATGGAGFDTYLDFEGILGSQLDDSLTGNGLNNTIFGGRGADFIDGRAGDDRLIGGGDGDSLTGGAGADTFVYLNSDDSFQSQMDTINDFEIGIDKLDLTGVRRGASDTFAIRYQDGNAFVDVDLDGDGTIDMMIGLSGISGGLSGQDLLWT